MRTAALALTLALAPAPAAPPGPLRDAVGGVVDRLIPGRPPDVPPSPTTVPVTVPPAPLVTPAGSPSPAPTKAPAPARTTPAHVTEVGPASSSRPKGTLQGPTEPGPATPGAATPEAIPGLVGPWGEPAPEDSDPAPGRTVYVFGLVALALPAAWVLARRRRPRPAVTAATYEEAYELGRADERAAADRPSARVIPFTRRDSKRPPAR